MKARLCLSKPRKLPASLPLRSWAVVVSVNDLRKFSDTSATSAPQTNGMHQHQQGQQLAADQGHILKRGKETALARFRYFTHVSGAGAVFAAHGQALEQARHQQ